jgi:PTS system nitrogen regulatory IIA component
MAGEDFDIESLAAYLHLDPAKVRRMAERGKIPGRRSGRDWRFSAAEIHHWLEERIVGADAEEQTRLESVLEQQAPAMDPEEVSVEGLVVTEAIACPLPARTKDSVIREMVALAAGTGWLWDPDRMVEAVQAREEMFPTAMEGGIALLHPRRPMGSILGRPFLAVGRTERGVPFGDPGGGLTDLFFLLLSTDDAVHLRTLARLSRVLGGAGVLEALRESPDADSLREVLVGAERGLPD